MDKDNADAYYYFGKQFYDTGEKNTEYIYQLENLLEGFYKEVNNNDAIKVNNQQMCVGLNEKKNFFKEEKFSF